MSICFMFEFALHMLPLKHLSLDFMPWHTILFHLATLFPVSQSVSCLDYAGIILARPGVGDLGSCFATLMPYYCMRLRCTSCVCLLSFFVCLFVPSASKWSVPQICSD
ncbi:hypothetical protein BDW66DRAFT_68457 [Aspergillus desertorum]